MGDYRAYILGIDGRRFFLVKEFAVDYPNDAAALSAAKRLADTHDVEVWDGGRLVARLSSTEEMASGFPPLAPAVPSDDREKIPVEPADPVGSVLELADCILKAKASTKVIE
jgi:hypothetical protein